MASCPYCNSFPENKSSYDWNTLMHDIDLEDLRNNFFKNTSIKQCVQCLNNFYFIDIAPFNNRWGKYHI